MMHEAPTTATPAPDGDRPEAATPRDEAGAEAESGSADPGAGRPREIGGRDGPEPTRYGDWEKNGRCIDF